MIAQEGDHGERRVALQLENAVDALAGLGAAVDVVAEKNELVAGPELRDDLAEEVVEGLEVAVDVADRDGCQRFVSPKAEVHRGDSRGFGSCTGASLYKEVVFP